MTKPREYTRDEVQQKFLDLVRTYIEYWDNLPDKNCKERLEGLAFSVMVILDGRASGLPGFIVAPLPHPEAKEFCRNDGENWFPENDEGLINCDIAGELHDLIHQ